MKKIYVMPALQVNEAQVNNMMAVSRRTENADPNAEVLTKEDTGWSIWNDEE